MSEDTYVAKKGWNWGRIMMVVGGAVFFIAITIIAAVLAVWGSVEAEVDSLKHQVHADSTAIASFPTNTLQPGDAWKEARGIMLDTSDQWASGTNLFLSQGCGYTQIMSALLDAGEKDMATEEFISNFHSKIGGYLWLDDCELYNFLNPLMKQEWFIRLAGERVVSILPMVLSWVPEKRELVVHELLKIRSALINEQNGQVEENYYAKLTKSWHGKLLETKDDENAGEDAWKEWNATAIGLCDKFFGNMGIPIPVIATASSSDSTTTPAPPPAKPATSRYDW